MSVSHGVNVDFVHLTFLKCCNCQQNRSCWQDTSEKICLYISIFFYRRHTGCWWLLHLYHRVADYKKEIEVGSTVLGWVPGKKTSSNNNTYVGLKMGKKNSKLKDDTLDQLCADTYCKYERGWTKTQFTQISSLLHSF